MSVALYSGAGSAGANTCEAPEDTYADVYLSLAVLGLVLISFLYLVKGSLRCWNRVEQCYEQNHKLTRAVQQLQALMHAEHELTRDRIQTCMEDMQARIQAVMNKLMRTAEELSMAHAVHANLGDGFRSHQLAVQKHLLQAKKDLEALVQQLYSKLGDKVASVPNDLKKTLDAALQGVADRSDKKLESVTQTVKEDFATMITFLTPMKRAQEQFTTAMGGRFNDILKELANAAYNLSKQNKDNSAQARWIQQTVDHIQTNTEHLPDKMNFIRNLLEGLKDLSEQVQKDVAAMDAEPVDRGSPSAPTEGPTPPPPPTATSSSVPTMLNLDESLPVQMSSSRQGGYLMPIVLPDARTSVYSEACPPANAGAHAPDVGSHN